MAKRRAAQNGQQGSIIVLTAILAVVLIAFAAFAVDLGNAFARKRLLQTQADLAALAGAGSLPDETAARAAALAYLQNNKVAGAQDFNASQITVSSDNLRITVKTPPARVNFGLAGVLGAGGQDVTADATAGVFSPGALAPFFIAEGCLTPNLSGSRLEIKTDPGNVTPTPVNPAFFPSPSNPNNSWPALEGAPTPLELIPNGGDQPITIRGDNLENIDEIGVIWGEDETTERLTIPSGSFTITPGAKNNDPDLINFIVPAAVTVLIPAPFDQTRVAFFQVRATAATSWSAPNAEASVNIPLPGADLPDACGEKSTGDFGLIDSPRDGSKNLDASQRNVALGLDHPVFVYPGGASALTTQSIPAGQTEDAKWNDICVKYTALPAFVLDIPNAVRPNCFEIYTGNKVTVLDSGLIEGGSGPAFDGRLDADQSAACSPRPKRANVQLNTTWEINDDLLSCFIMDNKTVGDVLNVKPNQTNAQLLEGAIVDSPRFLIVPVIWAEYPPANGSYPIVDYRGAMIAADKVTSTKAAPKWDADNGLTVSNKKIGSMTVTYFNLEALPETVSSTGNVIEYIGKGPRVIRLIE